LDPESEVDHVDLASGMDELKGRLEILLGARAEAPVDESQKHASDSAVQQWSPAQRERMAAAAGELLGAACKFLGELAGPQGAAPPAALVAQLRAGLTSCLDQGSDGKPRLVLPLPDAGVLENLAQAVARLLNGRM
jgi:hypothetical protein